MPNRTVFCAFALALCMSASAAMAGPQDGTTRNSATVDSLQIPKLDFAPTFDDFTGMQPSARVAASMLKIEGFTQRDPKDGAPVSQKTIVYAGYTDKHLYIICLCFDDQPDQVRARMVRREQIDDDDQFGFIIDTFQDHKNGVFFYMNPMGIQQDGVWVEGNNPDYSYDMVWDSKAALTGQGYIGFYEIPFKQLRFRRAPEQHWGILFERDIRRNNEASFYPRVTSNTQGFLSQEAPVTGLREISPGRNMQFNPYVSYRAYRALDDRDISNPRFSGRYAEPRVGMDSKIILKDALVLDATINPDFAQVESDEPQITVNQRFEVFFPEKRPFFLENSGFFSTPINLVFTRRIADPEYGVRLTGKLGPWAIGMLLADDKSPGKSVIESDPLSGHKAYFGIVRINRDIGKENTLGIIYTDRELQTPFDTQCNVLDDNTRCTVAFNRIGGIDGKFKFGKKWQMFFQALASSTKFNDGSRLAGPTYEVYVERSSRNVEFNSLYDDTAPGFVTYTGFFRRPDIRHFSNFFQYRFYRKKSKSMVWHGPSIYTNNEWDHKGLRLTYYGNVNYKFNFQRQTNFGVYGNYGHERLRPEDFTALTSNVDYSNHQKGFFFYTGYFKQVILNAEMNWGRATNYDPALGPPVSARANNIWAGATVRPFRGLTVENKYILARLSDWQTGLNVFNDHIIRSKWNYQFTREMSVRIIGQYNSTLRNSALSSLDPQKAFNADFLFTYLVHPGTAIYVGYNSDMQNYASQLCDRDPTGHCIDPTASLLRNRYSYLNDGRQIFVKLAYLFRF